MRNGIIIQGQPQSVVLVFILGVLISSAAFYVTRHEEEKRIQAEFQRRAEVQYDAFRESIDRYQELLRMTRGYFAHSDEVTRREFQGFASEVMARYAGIQALAWVPRVAEAERAAYEAAARRDGIAEFQLFDKPSPDQKLTAAARAEHFPIFYIEPRAGNEAALGFDLAAGPTQVELGKARDSDLVTATHKIRLVQEVGSQFGWVMMLPVYSEGLPAVASTDDRRRALRGYVEGVFRVDDLMTAVWQQTPFAGLDTLVLDGSAAVTNRFFYFHSARLRKEKVPPPSDLDFRAGMAHEIKSQLIGREWVFLFRPAPEWLAGQYTFYPYIILATGFLFTALLASYLRSLYRRAALVEEQVTQRTASLTQANAMLETEMAERKKAEADRLKFLGEREEIFKRFQTTLNHMPVGCVLTDAEFKFSYWNPAAERIFGYTFDEARGRQPYEVITPPKSKLIMEEFFRRLKNGEATTHGFAENLRKDGRTILCEWNNAPLRGPDAEFMGMLSMCQDITERHRAEAERQEMEHNLRETQKLESLGVLAGGIAHDFNNLLTGILGNSSLARMELPASAQAQEYLRQIEVASLRAADLCKQMLAYSGRGRFVVEQTNLSRIVEETAHLLRHSISKKAELKLTLAKDLPLITADVSQMQQIVMNLVINASEAIGDQSGVIAVATGLVRVDREYMANTFLAPDLPEGDYALLEVTDNGCGMDEATQARIFEPFFTTKFTGRGLGLAAVLGIVRGHRGTLKVSSHVGRGTTFRLLLPCQKRATPIVPPPEPVKSDWHGKGTILVADDEETVSTVVAHMLVAIGFEAEVARDGREALEKFQADPGRFRLVLLDLTMPRMDGEETFREMRRIQAGVRVILMSGFSEQDAVNRFTGTGLDGFIQKPFGPEALQEKLMRVLNGAEI